MDDLKDLKKIASPKHQELIDSLNNHESQNEIVILLLDRLCTLKEDQGEGEKLFRDDWQQSKRREGRMSLYVLVLANLALYLDFARDDSFAAAIVNSLKGIF